MFKRFACIILSTVMLLISSPVFAVPVETTALSAAAEPVTMESILSDFHAQSFSADGQDSNTIKQKTINQLTEAGYSAYDLNPATLSSLENSLNTDFSAMGLDPEGSYLIIVSGEDQPSAEISPITPPGGTDICGFGDGDALPPIHQYDPDQPPGGDTFSYTYNGTTYLMRYVTVLSSDMESELYVEKDYLLSNIDNLDRFINVFPDTVLSITSLLADEVPILSTLSTLADIASLIGNSCDVLFNGPLTSLDPETLVLRSATAWTRSYIQVYNNELSRWHTAQWSSYAISRSHFDGGYVLPEGSDEPVQFGGISRKATTYSPFYNNPSERKYRAVLGYNTGDILGDGTGDIHFYFVCPDGEINFGVSNAPLITHEESLAYILAVIP